ncbi:MAG: hypothetical protein JWL63_384 [Rhodocyclales bacterium]|nr:hypothetical protein [Rhodocyclales bacterium]
MAEEYRVEVDSRFRGNDAASFFLLHDASRETADFYDGQAVHESENSSALLESAERPWIPAFTGMTDWVSRVMTPTGEVGLNLEMDFRHGGNDGFVD